MDAMPMPAQDDEAEEQAAIQKLIAELEQLAQGGKAQEIAGRLGKGPLDEGEEGGGEDALEAEDAEPVPGAEPDDGEEGGEGDAEAASGPDPDKMRALLAKLKSQPSTMG